MENKKLWGIFNDPVDAWMSLFITAIILVIAVRLFGG